MEWSIFEYENEFITITREDINGVPSLKFRPKGYDGKLPTVIVYHGWHSSKEFMRFKAMTIASYGYQVIAPDALHHGERNPINHDDPQNLENYLWKIVLQSVNESKGFIKSIIDYHQANPMRIGVTGTSMGGVTAGGVFVNNPNLKCMIGVNGSFAWQESSKRNQLPPLNQENKEAIKTYDPMYNEDKINKRPILMLHGIEDTSLPIDGQRLFYNKLLPIYSDNLERFKLEEYNGIDHKLTLNMLQEMITWFKKYL